MVLQRRYGERDGLHTLAMGMAFAAFCPAMTAWEREDIEETRVEETRVGWFFALALAFFIFALLGIGTFLRYLW